MRGEEGEGSQQGNNDQRFFFFFVHFSIVSIPAKYGLSLFIGLFVCFPLMLKVSMGNTAGKREENTMITTMDDLPVMFSTETYFSNCTRPFPWTRVCVNLLSESSSNISNVLIKHLLAYYPAW